MVVKESGALIKATCVRGVPEAEELEIKLMAKLVAKCTHERAKRRDLRTAVRIQTRVTFFPMS